MAIMLIVFEKQRILYSQIRKVSTQELLKPTKIKN